MEEFLSFELFSIKNYTLDVGILIALVVFIAIVGGVLKVVKKLIYRSNRLNTGEKFTINKIVRYITYAIAFVIGLRIAGFDISVLLAGSAALLVGIGFGLQNIFNDFISGIILLLDGSLKVDDIVEVNGSIYLVEEIRFRTTTVLGQDENYVILPNSELTRNNVVNWTYKKKASRFHISLGVDYSTNVPELMELLKEVAKSTPRVLETPEPFVRFADYGESALKFGVYFYTHDIFRAEHIKSLMRVEIYKELNAKGINIPFPQRVVHFMKDEEGGMD